MDNSETVATLGTHDTRSLSEKTGGGNEEWTIQRQWQHWAHITHEEDT